MRSSSKRKIFGVFVIASIIINALLLVNVFALKKSSGNNKIYRSVIESKEGVIIPLKHKARVLSNSEENLFNTSYELARIYEVKGDNESKIQTKREYYSLALLEYAKLPKKNPYYAKLVRNARERIQPNMLEDTTLLISTGCVRNKVKSFYGQPVWQQVDKKFLPFGIVTREYYDKQGLVVGISNNKVFEIKMCSNFPGSWYGIKIGDSFDKIKAVYPGKKVALPGNKFGYLVDKLKTTFVFVDKDDKLDGMRVLDKDQFGNWELVLK